MNTFTLSTRLGQLRGFERLGARTFLGIRYAEPPQRFRAPVRSGAWRGVHDATAFAPKPIQRVDPNSILWPEAPGGYAEDCLFLNIHTPIEQRASARPVLVWIHGGAFVCGSANEYDGSALACSADAVVVAINYRLGLFGTVDVRALGSDYRSSCNLWLLDQLAALEWIHDNIADFGGDPTNVTVLGQSAGATSTITLAASARGEGLMHRAVASSPAFVNSDVPPHAARIAMLRGLQPEDVPEYLLHLPAAELLSLGDQVFPQPFVDGEVIPAMPEQMLRARSKPAVPLITGLAPHEGLFLNASYELQGRAHLLEGVAQAVAIMAAGGFAHARGYLARLQEVHAWKDGAHLSDLVWTDIFRRSSLTHAAAIAASGASAWHYVFDVPCVFAGTRMASTHCVDLPFTFNWFIDTQRPRGDWVAFDEANRALAASWVRVLAQFARNGYVDEGALGAWPAYDTATRSTLAITPQGCRIETDIDPEYRTRIWTVPA